MREIAAAHDATPAQVSLAWTIRHTNVVAIVGASRVAQVEENAAAAELALRSELLAGYRQRLSENRTTHPLFDMARFAAQLDDQLLAAWANRGQPR